MRYKLRTDRAKEKFPGDFGISALQHELWHCPRMTVVMLVRRVPCEAAQLAAASTTWEEMSGAWRSTDEAPVN